MPYCKNKDISIYYEQHGKGEPVILVHGIAVSFKYNFSNFSWVDKLTDNNMRVVGLDLRAHGLSDKPLDPSSYGTHNLTSDILAVMDELKIKRASIIGYSLGSALTLHLIHSHPDRFSRAVLVATGDSLFGLTSSSALKQSSIDLFLAISSDTYPHHLPEHIAAYWNFVNQSGANRQALLALLKGDTQHLSIEDISSIDTPTMIISGGKDLVLGQGVKLAEKLPESVYLEFKEADHFSLAAITDVKNAIVDFLR